MPRVTFSPAALCGALLAALLCIAGCGEPEIPRVKGDISAEMQSLPALYRTTGGEDVRAPGNGGDGGMVVVDEDSGQLAWRVWECHNPACPAKPSEGPTLFTCPNENYHVAADGSIGPEATQNYSPPLLYCPHCMKLRDTASETAEDRARYAGYIGAHVLPETAERQAELEEQMQVRIDHLKERMHGDSSP